MSKTPIRAALERLEGEEYVRVSPRQGIVVREPALREIADQFEIRLALERHVIESLAGNLAAAQVARLRDNLRQQRPFRRTASIRLIASFTCCCAVHKSRILVDDYGCARR
jgi:DNA-binding GntR family transcriptional regulator